LSGRGAQDLIFFPPFRVRGKGRKSIYWCNVIARRNDEAISLNEYYPRSDCFALLAMTNMRFLTPFGMTIYFLSGG
jgi:hypothetical protein